MPQLIRNGFSSCEVRPGERNYVQNRPHRDLHDKPPSGAKFPGFLKHTQLEIECGIRDQLLKRAAAMVKPTSGSSARGVHCPQVTGPS